MSKVDVLVVRAGPVDLTAAACAHTWSCRPTLWTPTC